MREKGLTLGSLFDGIGRFPLAGIRNGIKPIWASEILFNEKKSHDELMTDAKKSTAAYVAGNEGGKTNDPTKNIQCRHICKTQQRR